jgi:hypothetical protein
MRSITMLSHRLRMSLLGHSRKTETKTFSLCQNQDLVGLEVRISIVLRASIVFLFAHFLRVSGRKALLPVQKFSQRLGSGDGGEWALRDAQKYSQRRGSENSANAGASASMNSSNTTTDVTMDDWKTMRGRLQIQLQDSWGWCADDTIQVTDYHIFTKVKDWILLVLNDEGNFSYAPTDITVQEVSNAYTIGNVSIGPRASRASSSIWTYLVSNPDCRSLSAVDCQECVGRNNITLNVVFIQVRDKDHRRKIAEILTADLFKRPLPNDGISTPRANVTCPIQGGSACSCQQSSDISSGDISFGASVLDDCAWIIAAGTNGAINLKVSALTPGVPIGVYQCSTSSCQWGPPIADCGDKYRFIDVQICICIYS